VCAERERRGRGGMRREGGGGREKVNVIAYALICLVI